MHPHAEAGRDAHAVQRGAQQEAFDVLAKFVEIIGLAVVVEAIEARGLTLGGDFCVEQIAGGDGAAGLSSPCGRTPV